MIPTVELRTAIAATVTSVDNDQAIALTDVIVKTPRRQSEALKETRKALTQAHPDLLRTAALIRDAGTGLSDYTFRHVHDLQKDRAMKGRRGQVIFWLIMLIVSALASPVTWVLALTGTVPWHVFGYVLGAGSVLFVVSGLCAFRSNFPPRRAVIQSPPTISRNIWQAATDVHVAAALRAAGETGPLIDQLEDPWIRAGLEIPTRNSNHQNQD